MISGNDSKNQVELKPLLDERDRHRILVDKTPSYAIDLETLERCRVRQLLGGGNMASGSGFGL